MSAELINIFHRNENNRWWEYLQPYEDLGFDIETIPIPIHDYNFDDSKYNNSNVKEYLNIKHYIKITDECSICLEPILYKKNAILTSCGHCFHRNCIIKIKYNREYELPCPLCRHDLRLEHGDIIPFRHYNSKKILDKLEDFWNNIELLYPDICLNGDNLGMNKDCFYCNRYIKTGKK